MTALERLLAVQEHDTRLDQLRHRLDALPEREALAAAERDRSAAEAALADAQDRRAELAREQKRLEDQIASLEDKVTSVDKTLYSGTISNPRELQALQDDIGSLKRRVSLLEDTELEVMERLEPVEAEVAAHEAAVAAAVGTAESLQVQVTVTEAELGVEIDASTGQRTEAAGAVGDVTLLETYERIRGRSQGVGVARLVGGTCGGCHLKLSAVELDRLRREPSDALVYCEDCGRLLVR